jgi:hypothetical protein
MSVPGESADRMARSHRRGECLAAPGIRKQPIAELPDRPMPDRCGAAASCVSRIRRETSLVSQGISVSSRTQWSGRPASARVRSETHGATRGGDARERVARTERACAGGKLAEAGMPKRVPPTVWA